MSFIQTPNIPKGNVSLAVVDGRIPYEIENRLYSLKIEIIKTKKIEGVYDAIAYHPDIMLHHLGGKDIVAAPNISDTIAYELEGHGFCIWTGKREVTGTYPWDIAYNTARVGGYIICNPGYTDETILEYAQNHDIKVIEVKQGYAKCSTCIVDEAAVITSDRGIYEAVEKHGLDCCLINPGNITLFDMNYGFIGGASGAVSNNEIVFYGDINNHPEYEKINSFVIKNNKKIRNLGENIVSDFGSLIPLKEYSILTK